MVKYPCKQPNSIIQRFKKNVAFLDARLVVDPFKKSDYNVY